MLSIFLANAIFITVPSGWMVILGWDDGHEAMAWFKHVLVQFGAWLKDSLLSLPLAAGVCCLQIANYDFCSSS